MVGFLDFAPAMFQIQEKAFDRWVSTYCFALTAVALERLAHRLFDPSVMESCVPGGIEESGFFQNISPSLEAHLTLLLFRGGWYASRPLTSDNAKSFQFKAKCVIAEKWLSARCLSDGIALRDPFSEQSAWRWGNKVERRLNWEGQRLGKRIRSAWRSLRVRSK